MLPPSLSVTDSARGALFAAPKDGVVGSLLAGGVVLIVMAVGCGLSAFPSLSPFSPLLVVVVVVEPGVAVSFTLLPATAFSTGGVRLGLRLRKLSLLKSVSPRASGDGVDVGDDDSDDGLDGEEDPLDRNVKAADDSVEDNRSAAALIVPSLLPAALALAGAGLAFFCVGSAAAGVGARGVSPRDRRSSLLRSVSSRCFSCVCLTFSLICCNR
jgi:hypothetical protein